MASSIMRHQPHGKLYIPLLRSRTRVEDTTLLQSAPSPPAPRTILYRIPGTLINTAATIPSSTSPQPPPLSRSISSPVVATLPTTITIPGVIIPTPGARASGLRVSSHASQAAVEHARAVPPRKPLACHTDGAAHAVPELQQILRRLSALEARMTQLEQRSSRATGPGDNGVGTVRLLRTVRASCESDDGAVMRAPPGVISAASRIALQAPKTSAPVMIPLATPPATPAVSPTLAGSPRRASPRPGVKSSAASPPPSSPSPTPPSLPLSPLSLAAPAAPLTRSAPPARPSAPHTGQIHDDAAAQRSVAACVQALGRDVVALDWGRDAFGPLTGTSRFSDDSSSDDDDDDDDIGSRDGLAVSPAEDDAGADADSNDLARAYVHGRDGTRLQSRARSGVPRARTTLTPRSVRAHEGPRNPFERAFGRACA